MPKNPAAKFVARVAGLIRRITSPTVAEPSIDTTWEEEDYTAGSGHGAPVLDPWDPEGDIAPDRHPRSDSRSPVAPTRTAIPPVARHDTPGIGGVLLEEDPFRDQDLGPPDDSAPFEGDIDALDDVHEDWSDIDDGQRPTRQDVLDDPDDTQFGLRGALNALDDAELDVDAWDDPDDYDPDIRQSPWPVPPPDATRIAAGRAADIVALMRLTRRTDRDPALRYLTDLFEHLPHPATYRALRSLAEQLNIEEIQEMVSLREAWLDSDAWTGGFSWRFAHRVCRARSEYMADEMIDDDWVSDGFLHP